VTLKSVVPPAVLPGVCRAARDPQQKPTPACLAVQIVIHCHKVRRSLCMWAEQSSAGRGSSTSTRSSDGLDTTGNGG
jgi:hypothetical protein